MINKPSDGKLRMNFKTNGFSNLRQSQNDSSEELPSDRQRESWNEFVVMINGITKWSLDILSKWPTTLKSEREGEREKERERRREITSALCQTVNRSLLFGIRCQWMSSRFKIKFILIRLTLIHLQVKQCRHLNSISRSGDPRKSSEKWAQLRLVIWPDSGPCSPFSRHTFSIQNNLPNIFGSFEECGPDKSKGSSTPNKIFRIFATICNS